MKRKARFELQLTRRALRDIREIDAYSREHWGESTAEQYLNELESGLQRLRENPELLKPEPDFHDSLTFYRVNKHLFVCDTRSKSRSVVVLTVIHSSMDIQSRLAELQPTLAAEVELLHRKLKKSRRRPARS